MITVNEMGENKPASVTYLFCIMMNTSVDVIENGADDIKTTGICKEATCGLLLR